MRFLASLEMTIGILFMKTNTRAFLIEFCTQKRSLGVTPECFYRESSVPLPNPPLLCGGRKGGGIPA